MILFLSFSIREGFTRHFTESIGVLKSGRTTMIYDTQGFAARLSALREKRGLTQEQLAERSGLSAH